MFTTLRDFLFKKNDKKDLIFSIISLQNRKKRGFLPLINITAPKFNIDITVFLEHSLLKLVITSP